MAKKGQVNVLFCRKKTDESQKVMVSKRCMNKKCLYLGNNMPTFDLRSRCCKKIKKINAPPIRVTIKPRDKFNNRSLSQLLIIHLIVNTKHTRQIAGKKPPLIPISIIGIERIEDIEKKIFVQNYSLSPISFDGFS